MTDTINVPRELRQILGIILNALDRDAAEGRAPRGEMAQELRALLAQPAADSGLKVELTMNGQQFVRKSDVDARDAMRLGRIAELGR